MMAKLILDPIGSAINENDFDYRENLQLMAALDERLKEKRKKVAAGWGASYQERVIAKKKLTAEQRVLALADDADVFAADEVPAAPAAGPALPAP